MGRISKRTHKIAIRQARLKEKLKGLETALRLQATENLRRLDELNHAHARQVETQRTYVSDDKFNGFVGEINQFRNSVSKTIAEFTGTERGMVSARALTMSVIALLIPIVALIVFLWKK